MAEVVRVIEEPVRVGRTAYRAQICGQQNGHMWEGWIEFESPSSADVRRTPRETTQPDREALVYWAQGISPTYLEGALLRTFDRPVIVATNMPKPYFDAPAPPFSADEPEGPRTGEERAVLDPFSVGEKGLDLLRRELGALRAWHLRNIVRAYDLTEPERDIEAMSAPELVELIVSAVEAA